MIGCLLVFAACNSDSNKTKETSIQTKLTRGKKEARWVMENRWVGSEMEKNSDPLLLLIDNKGNIDINGHKTTYKLLHDERYLQFVYVYEDTHEYYLDILHISDTAFIYELRNCEFQTVKEKLVPYED